MTPADTQVVAKLIGRSPEYVRALARRGILTPVDVAKRRGSGGRPMLLFDLQEVQDKLYDTPYWVR